MNRFNLLNLIDAIGRDEAALRGQEFLAPLLGGRVHVRVRGLVYALRVASVPPGWWVCRMEDARRAAVVGEALPWQRGEYLALLPALRLVLLEPLAHGDWSALPYNPSDASQRFGIVGPLVVRLAEGGRPFERAIGRVQGTTVWYDEPDRRGDPALAEALRSALDEGIESPVRSGAGPGERAAYGLLLSRRAEVAAARAAAEIQGRLLSALELGGARLIGYEPSGDTLRVTWERDGQRSVTLVGAGLDVISAGICLSGQDGRFDLASIVGVVREAPGFARYEDGGRMTEDDRR